MKQWLSLPVWGLSMIALNAQALSLDEYLSQVVEKNRAFASYRESKDAAELRAEAGDVGLLPRLTLSYGEQDDKKLPS
ncbi:MAG TPA: hypothetical protein PLU50_11375, partial [Pseudobdellovibrionaceae bacterium]|nr:hypothetical protein [Pseudobdellovibrionaceae bacterium]